MRNVRSVATACFDFIKTPPIFSETGTVYPEGTAGEIPVFFACRRYTSGRENDEAYDENRNHNCRALWGARAPRPGASENGTGNARHEGSDSGVHREAAEGTNIGQPDPCD